MKKRLFLALVLNLCVIVKSSAQSQTPAQIFSAGMQEAWVVRHNEKGNSHEDTKAMAFDATGNIYVTGSVDSAGGPRDYLTVKYNAAGVKQWTARYNGPAKGDDYAAAIAVDGDGNVYVTGSSAGSSTGYDFVTIKYTSAGVKKWTAIYNGNWHDYAVALAVDRASGDVYVTGYGASFDYATVKYNPDGIQQWAQTLGGGGKGDDAPVALIVDDAGNVYVTGTRGFNYYTIKYNSAGTKLWAVPFYGLANGKDYAADLGIDSDGNVYVTGSSWSGTANDDYATVKYNSNGKIQWVATYNRPDNGHDRASALGIDPESGDIYVTGSSGTVKYNPAGTQKWLANGAGNALALDPADGESKIYVAGSKSNGANYDYVTIKYDSAGAEKGAATYNGPGNGDDKVVALIVDSKGNVYVTGSSFGAGTNSDFATIKYTDNVIANAGPDKEICAGQSVPLGGIGGSPTAVGGKQPYTYKWTPATGLDNPTAANPIATPAATTEYTVEATDANGVKAADKIIVTAKPCAIIVFPAANALDVNKATNIACIFASPVDPATLTNSTIRVNGSQSGLHKSSNITYDSGTRKATFDPASDFKPGEVVNVTLTTGIKSASGVALTNAYTWSFVIKSPSGTSTFVIAESPKVGYNPSSTTTADLDGDGDLDLAVANLNSNNVSILKNGNGIFTATAVVVGNGPNSVIAGDFDGDGNLDLAVANLNSNNVSIVKNGGNGVFTSTAVGVGNKPYSVATGDWDGDGDLDLVTANSSSNNISILKNGGNGIFSLSSPVGVGNGPHSLAVGDFDGDGDLDMAVVNRYSKNVSLLMNSGNGAFVPSLPVSMGNNPISVIAGDLDGDGDLDLAVTNNYSNSVSILKNAGKGAFTTSSSARVESGPASVAAGDFDGDGDLDLAVTNNYSNSVSILKNSGNGTFAQSSTGWVEGTPNSVAAGDYDGDGDLDLAVGNHSSNILSILKNGLITEAGANTKVCLDQSVRIGGMPTAANGAPPYTYKWTPAAGLNDPTIANPLAAPTVTTTYTVEVTDAGGAKVADKTTVAVNLCASTVFPAQNALKINKATNIAFTFAYDVNPATLTNNTIKVYGSQSGLHTSNNITYDSGTRKAIFNPVANFKPGEGVQVTLTPGIKSAAGAASAGYNWSFTIQSGGTGAFAKVGNFAAGDDPIATTTGDFDRDGDLDLAVANRNSGNVSILKNNGSGTFVPSATPALGREPFSVTAGDWDGDGDLDLAVAIRISGSITILKNNGNGIFTPSATPRVKGQPYSVAAGDFDGDGDLDLAAANFDSGAVSILKNNGSGVFAASAFVRGLNHPRAIATGDFDDDGDLDLAAANSGANSVAILKNDGNGVFVPSATVGVESNPASIAAGDFNGDGDLDLAVANKNSNNVSILQSNDQGVFTQTSTVWPGSYGYPASIAAGDFDGDGDLDLTVGNEYHWSNNIAILKNDGRGAFASTNLYVGNGPASVAVSDFDGDGDLDLAVTSAGADNVTLLKNGLIAKAGPDAQICAGQSRQSVILGSMPTATNGAPPYTYKWTPTTGLNDPVAANPIASPTATTTYTVEVTDTTGAKAVDRIIVSVYPCAGSVSPAPNAIKANKAANITVKFNEAINPKTITDSTLFVNASQSGLHRSSKITYDSTAKILVFDPDSDFKPGEVVNVTLAPGVRSAAGDPIIPNNWSFTIQTLKGTGAFANVAGPNVDAAPTSIAAGDFDGDGDLDLAAAKNADNHLAILQNDGNGNFAISSLPAIGRNPLSVTAGDLDQDGDSDLAVTHSGDLFISVLRNDGNGNFAARTDYNTGSSWSDVGFIAAADVDRDGDLDLALIQRNGGKVSIFKNRGDATFPNRVDYPVARNADDAAVADLDNDGDLDLAITSWEAPGLTLFENSGNGTFFKKSETGVETNPIGIVAADLNADGFVDLAVANNGSNTVSILQNDKSWNFTHTSVSSGGLKPYGVIAIDPDANGHLDLAITNNSSNIVTLLRNDGSGHFTQTANLNVGSQPRYPLAGDFDGDGDLDLAVVNVGANSISILKNGLIAEAGAGAKICFGQSGQTVALGGVPTAANGKAPYTYKWTPTTGLNNPAAANPMATLTAATEYKVEVTDATGAKAVDKVTVTAYLCSAVEAVTPAPTARNATKAANLVINFAAAIDSATLTNATIRVNGAQSGLHTSNKITYDKATKKAIFDPTKDFKPGEMVHVTLTPGIKSASSVALASYLWSFAIQSGGSSVFTNAGDVGMGNRPVATAAGDFDGDGDLDLAVANYYSNNLAIMKNNGIGTFTITSVAVGNSPFSVAASDFDFDGDLDLAVANFYSSNVSILKNNGAGIFTPSSTPSVGSQPISVAAGDFDGDGDLDLAAANSNSNYVSILKNDGKGAFIPGLAVNELNRPYSIAVGDFDSDGDLDLAAAIYASNAVSILKNDGNGLFAARSPVSVGNGPAFIVAGDFDGDKDWDLATANSGSGNVSILTNDGSGVLTPTSVAVGSNPAALAAGDFDGDGDWDLAAANSGANNVSILKNNGSSIFTTTTVVVGNNPNSLTAGDLDGDGDLDLATANSSSNTVSILKNALIAEAGPNTEICSGQSATLGGNPTATNGASPYTYNWTPITGLDNAAAANPVATPTATTTYTVEVTDAKGGKAVDQVTVTVPVTGWSVAHIVDADDEIFGVNQNVAPRENRALALSPNKRFLYLGYNAPASNRVVRKIDLSVVDPANNHNAVIAQLKLPLDAQPARDIATDDRGRVYLALGTKIDVYNSNLQTTPLHSISGFTACEGVTTRRESGILVVYATDRQDKTLERFVLVEGAGEAIASSKKAGLDGDGEVQIIGANSPRGLDIAGDGTAWIADNGKGKVYRLSAAGGTVDSISVGKAMDVAIDATRGEVYVSQFTLRTIKVLNLSTGKIKRTLTPPAADLKIDLDGENPTGAADLGALSGIDVGSCQRVYVANEKGRSILTGNPPDSPFSNAGDDHNVKAADADPVLLVTGNVVAKESEVEESEVAKSEVVTSYELAQNYPNPFNPSTKINFALPEAAEVSLKIYDVAGQLVQTLVNGVVQAGRHQVVWDGTNRHGAVVASGVYFYQLRTGEFKQVRRMSLVR